MRREEISPFLGRDYKHLADYAPVGTTRDERQRADTLKAKMLIERLLFKKFDRSGTLRWCWIQRLGDWGRREGLNRLLFYLAMVELAVIVCVWWMRA